MFLHTEGFTLNAEKIVYRSFAYISFTQNFLHADAQKPFIKKSVRAQTLLCKTFAHTNVKLTGAPGSFIPRRVSYTELVRYQCFWGRNLFVRKTFLAGFYTQSLTTHVLKPRSFLIFGRILVHPPGFFHTQQLWNRKLLKPLLTMSFIAQRFLSFFERKLFIKIICGEF